VIQVTSPNASDGKSTVSSNLAISIAQSGKSVLLIDADFRRPRQHQIFPQPAGAGFAAVLAGEVNVSDVIHAGPLPHLSLLPCGPLPRNPAELLSSPRLPAALDELRQRYDFVIIDTPPLLAVSDPSVVVPRVDGVLLVVRMNKGGRPPAERARELLATLQANVLGVVLNGLGRPNKKGNGYQYYGGQYSYAASYYTGGESESAGATSGDGGGQPSGAGGARPRRRGLAEIIRGWRRGR
jgi:capsular exopolysaccharide synthesis family protein